jgi:hypothetical protein
MEMETWTWRHGHGNIDMETWTWRHGHGDMDMETRTLRHGHGDMDMETWTWRHGQGDMDRETWRQGDIKRRTEAQAIFPNPFTICHRANRSLLFVPLLTKKQTEVIRLQPDLTD